MDSVKTGDQITLYLDKRGYMGIAKVKSETFKLHQFHASVFEELEDVGAINVFTLELSSDYQMMGENIFYGESIRLKHTASGRYLGVSNVASSEASDEFVSQLYETATDKCQFQISPRHKMRNEGEQVYPEDIITLADTSDQENFLGCSGQESIITSQAMPLGWKIQVYARFSHQPVLRNGNFIRLFHKEIEGFLSLRQSDSHIRKFDKSVEKLLDFHHSNSKQFMLGVKAKGNNETNTLMSIWEIVNINPESGDSILWNNPFRLKHAATGLYIRVKLTEEYLQRNNLRYEKGSLVGNNSGIRAKKTDYMISFTKNQTPATLFRAVPIPGQEESEYMIANRLIRLKHAETQTILKVKSNFIKNKTQSAFFKKASFVSGFAGFPNLKDELKDVHCSQGSGDSDVFLISNCKNINLDYLLFAKSMAEELRSFYHLLKFKQETNIYFQMKIILQNLELTNDFVRGKIAWSKYDEKSIEINWESSEEGKRKRKKYSKPIKRRQKAIRELLGLEHLLGIIDHFWGILPKNINSNNLDSSTRTPWNLCKRAHSLMKSLLTANKRNISVIIELGGIQMMFEQISTGWQPCISEIFTTNNPGVTVINKNIIKAFIDQIEELLKYEFPHKILDFLASICAPAGVGDYKIQKWVIEMLVGNSVSAQSVPSSLIYHTKTEEDDLQNTKVFLLTSNIGFLRPPFLVSKEVIADYTPIGYNEGYFKDYSREWIELEKFLPGPSGELITLSTSSLVQSVTMDGEVTDRQRMIYYYRSQLKLYTAACKSQHYKNQKIVSALVSVDHILAILTSISINSIDKAIYLDLFNELYVNSAVLGPLSTSILPSILIWEGQRLAERRDDNDPKLFCINSQPYLASLLSDWVTSWGAQGGSVDYVERDDVLISSNVVILEQRFELYNFCIAEFLDILDTIVIENNSLSRHVFGEYDDMSARWTYRLNYYISFCKVLEMLLLRQFFDDNYNSDVDGSYEDSRIVRVEVLPIYKKLYEEDKHGLIPISEKAKKNLLLVFQNFAINILVETSPSKQYSIANLNSPEKFNKVFLWIEENPVNQLLVDFKKCLISLLTVLHDSNQTSEIYELWNDYFKECFNEQFRDLDYRQIVIQKKIVRLYNFVSTIKYAPYDESNKYTELFNNSRNENMSDLEKINTRVDSFCEYCRPKLAHLKGNQDELEFQNLSKVLLDLILYQHSGLALESTNMLYKLFSKERERGKVYKEAVLLLDDNYYKVYKLLHFHHRKLIKLTRNFTRLPKKPKEIIQFYKLFRAGNPLMDTAAKKYPGLIDLCYGGVDLDDSDYIVFKRNMILYANYQFSSREEQLKKVLPRKKGGLHQLLIQQHLLQTQLVKISKEKSLQDACDAIKNLSVNLLVGKIDLWSKNQELMKNIGLHHSIIKLLFSVLDKNTKFRQSTNPKEYFCQRSMVDVCFDFLYFFVWDNDQNSMDLTNQSTLDMFFYAMDASDSVPKLLTEIIVDNDEANSMIQDDFITDLVTRLSKDNWVLKDNEIAYPVKYVELLKTMVESDLGPKPFRQKQVIEQIMKIPIEIFLMKNSSDDYDLESALLEFKQLESVKEKSHDNFDLTNSETLFNLHLQFLDLLGLCCIGHNLVSYNFCKGLYPSEDSIIKPLITDDVPVFIRAPFTRLLHGIYFSDAHESYESDIWSIFPYQKFKLIFVKIGNSFKYLLTLFQQDSCRKNRIFNDRTPLLDTGDNINELRIFIELEQYGDYVFDIVLPFLTNLLMRGLLTQANDDGDSIKILPWDDLSQDLEIDLSVRLPMSYLFRTLVFFVIKMTSFTHVLYKENFREAIRDFLRACIDYLNDHHRDPQSLLEDSEIPVKQMQIKLISTINILENARESSSNEWGDIDLELIDERQQQALIKDKALPEFLKALSAQEIGDHAQIAACLRKEIKYYTVDNEFAKYVRLLLDELESFIAWEDKQEYSKRGLEKSTEIKSTVFQIRNHSNKVFTENANKKEKENDFPKWTRFGGRYLFRLIELLNNIKVEGESDSFHLRALQALLIKYEDPLQISDLKRRQSALAKLGVVNLTMSIISRVRDPSSLSVYMKKMIPEVINLGSNLLSLGNRDIQNQFMEEYNLACQKLSLNQFFLTSLKNLIREAKYEVKFLNTERGDLFLSRLIPNLLSFVKNICEGHNRPTQEFLSTQSYSNIDLISELAAFLVTVTEKVQKHIMYMTTSIENRKLIAWHKQNCKLPDIGDLNLCSHLLKTLAECIQGPCIKNQVTLTISRCCRYFNSIFEFIGAFLYRKDTTWSGHGMSMYLENTKDDLEESLEVIEINQFYQLMEVIATHPDQDPKKLVFLIDHSSEEYMAYIESLDNLEQDLLVFYNSMLEGNQKSEAFLTNGEKIKENLVTRVPVYIYETIDDSLFVKNLHNYWRTANLQKVSTMISELQDNKEGHWNSKQRKKVFLYYSFLSLIGEKCEDAYGLREKIDSWEQMNNANMRNVVGRIEIQNSVQELEVVYFPKPPIVRMYWRKGQVKDLRNELLYGIKRDTPEEKIIGFQDISTDLIICMEHMRSISLFDKKVRVLGKCYKIIAENNKYLLFVLALLTIYINVLLVQSLETDGDNLEYDDNSVLGTIEILAIVHFIFSIFSFLSYTFMKGVTIVKTQLKRRNSRDAGLPKFLYKGFKIFSYRLTLTTRQTVKLPAFLWIIYFYMSVPSSLYYLAFAGLSGLGVFYDPGFFSFHLIVLIKEIRMTRYVMSSVTNNIRQVLATFLLALIVLFWFIMIAYNSKRIRGLYEFEGLMASEDLYEFLKTHIAYGFTVNPYWKADEELSISGMFYVMIYFIIINLILTAIVTGIIIDSFSEMRTMNNEIKDDNDDKCFVCNIDRDEFEKEEINFQGHIKRDHNLWNYLFFQIHLASLDPIEMTGLESYVYKCMNERSIAFFPIKKSILIQGREKYRKDLPSLFDKIHKLEASVQKITQEISYDKEKRDEEIKKITQAIEKITNLN